MDSIPVGTTREFHRSRLLWGFVITIPIAIAVGTLFPRSSGYLVAAVVLALGFVICVVPYWSDKIAFTSDGQLVNNRSVIDPASVTRFHFATSVAAGRTPRVMVFALYSREGGDVMPRCVIPIHGWASSEKAALFCALRSWLATTNAETDERTRIRLDALTQ